MASKKAVSNISIANPMMGMDVGHFASEKDIDNYLMMKSIIGSEKFATEYLDDGSGFDQKNITKQEPPMIKKKISNPFDSVAFTKKAGMGGLLEDWFGEAGATADKAVQQVIDANKSKAITAATTQATNLVGSQLNKLSTTDPKAAAAISATVASATAAAQDTAMAKATEWIKANQGKIIMYGGIAVGGMIALWIIKAKIMKGSK